MLNTKIKKPISEVPTRLGNTLTKLLVAVLFLSSACSSTYQTRSSDDDDIYYSTKDAPMNDEINYSTPADPDDYTYQYDDSEIEGSKSNTQEPTSTSEEYYEEDGNTYITNNYYSGDNYDFDRDDYYDYSYSARLRRFHSPVYGYGYYNSYYTNSYWYDYNPFNWGVSIYLSYPWWGFGYSTYGYGGYGYGGYGGYYGGHHGYYGGHHGYYSGHHGYYGGHHGYYSGYGGYGYDSYGGYYGGYNNPYYYNSYDANSYYYGPRSSTSSNGSIAPQTLAQLYQKDKKNSGMSVLHGDKTKFNQQSGQALTPSKGVTNAGKPISVKTGKGVHTAQDKIAVKEQHGLSPDKNADLPTVRQNSKDKAVVYTGKPVSKTNLDKPAINKPVESKSESYSFPGNNKPVQEVKYKSHVSPGYSQPKVKAKPGSYSSNDYYKKDSKSNTQIKSRTPYTYSKPKSNQRVDKPKSYGRSDYGNQSKPKTNSYSNYNKPKSSAPARSNYSNRSSSYSTPKHNYSSPKSSGQRGTSVGRTSSPSRSSSSSRTSSPSRTSKPRR